MNWVYVHVDINVIKNAIFDYITSLLDTNVILEKVFQNHYVDIHVISSDTQSIGIDQIKQLTKSLSFKPYTFNKQFGIILDAHKLTTQAQNAFLKMLEEHSTSTIFILTTNNENHLLPTIKSRCRIKYISTSDMSHIVSEEAVQFIKLNTDIKRLLFIPKLVSSSSTTNIIKFLENLIKIYQYNFNDNPQDDTLRKDIQTIYQTLQYIHKNVNTRLALENMTIHLQAQNITVPNEYL